MFGDCRLRFYLGAEAGRSWNDWWSHNRFVVWFAITAFFIIGIIGYLSKIETRLENLEIAEKIRRGNNE